jgi:general secretion pathway protein I
LKSGRQSGETAGHRWRIDVAPLTASSDAAQPGRWMPLSVNIQLQAPGGGAMRITTIRLVQRPVQ